MKHASSTVPQVRTIGLMRPLVWLVLAWRDMAHAGISSFCHGLVVTFIGAAIVAFARDKFWLLLSALTGFLVIAPVLATSLYALSRAMEQEKSADWDTIFKAWVNWQNNRFHRWNSDYWCMVQFGILLALASIGWVLTSVALITLLAPIPIKTPPDFIRYVVLAPDNWLFELWLAIGGLMAAPMFASSVVSMPLLLDRRISVMQAVLTSWRVILANPIPMALWAALIMLFTLLGFSSLLLGLVAVIPMLGHASWHAYRDLVDASMLPLREDNLPLH